MTVAMGVDLLVALLLVVTIVYAARLQGRLNALRGGRAELERIIGDFGQATARAEASIAALRENMQAGDAELKQKLADAHAVRDELAFMLDRGDSLADQLDRLIRKARGASSQMRGTDRDSRGLGGLAG